MAWGRGTAASYCVSCVRADPGSLYTNHAMMAQTKANATIARVRAKITRVDNGRPRKLFIENGPFLFLRAQSDPGLFGDHPLSAAQDQRFPPRPRLARQP